MLVSAIHQHESAIGIHMSPPKQTSLPPHSTPLHCHRALDLSSLHHTANSHWLSILYLVSIYFNATLPICPHCVHKSVFYICVSIAVLQMGSSVLMRWMNLQPTIQSEVSQKEKKKCHILMHISMESRKMVLMNLVYILLPENKSMYIFKRKCDRFEDY